MQIHHPHSRLFFRKVDHSVLARVTLQAQLTPYRDELLDQRALDGVSQDT